MKDGEEECGYARVGIDIHVILDYLDGLLDHQTGDKNVKENVMNLFTNFVKNLVFNLSFRG